MEGRQEERLQCRRCLAFVPVPTTCCSAYYSRVGLETIATIRKRSMWRDIGIAMVVALCVAALASSVELNEATYQFTRRFETLQLDEWPMALLAFALCMVLLYARRHSQLRRTLASNKELTARLLEVQEEERRSLARELHDELGQTLNALKLDARLVPALAPGRELDVVAGRITDSADHMYRVAGNLVTRLRPPALDELGLVDALEAGVDRWRVSYPSLEVSLSAGGDLAGLGETLNLAIYRLVQEALTNCVRHASASHFRIDLTRSPRSGGVIVLEMCDDGTGFEIHKSNRAGHGLRGMRERVALLGGHFELASGPGAGTRIRVELPARS